MTPFSFTDTLQTDGHRLTDAGYLHVNARVARTGIQTYGGAELGRPDVPQVRVYRDAAQVFDRAALESFAAIPITLEHPETPVTAASWKAEAVGMAGEEVLREGEFIKIGLRITDADAIAAVQAGKRELSVGYAAEIDWTPGEIDGQMYDAVQRDIRANHIALVDQGRAGPAAAIELPDTMPDTMPAPAVQPSAAATPEARALAAERAEIRELLALLVRMVLPDLDIAGLDADGIRRAVLAAQGVDLRDTAPAYVAGRFAAWADHHLTRTPPVRAAAQASTPAVPDPVGAAVPLASAARSYRDYKTSLTNAWKGASL